MGLRRFTHDDGVTFFGSLQGTGVDDSNDTGLWAERDGGLVKIMREGDPASGLGPDVFLGEPGSGSAIGPATQDGGRLSFSLVLNGSAVGSENDFSLWSEATGDLRLVAREGDPVPGLGVDVTWRFLGSGIANDFGETAFLGSLNDPSATDLHALSLWIDDAGEISFLAAEGGPTPAGGEFSSINVTRFNNRGKLAFEARFGEPGSIPIGGVFFGDADGLELALREGDILDGQTVGEMLIGNNFNDNNQLPLLVFTNGRDGIPITLDDETRIYVVTLPEPATLTLLLCLLGALAPRRPRRRATP